MIQQGHRAESYIGVKMGIRKSCSGDSKSSLMHVIIFTDFDIILSYHRSHISPR